MHALGPHLYIATSAKLSSWAEGLQSLAFKIGTAECFRERRKTLNGGFAKEESGKTSMPCFNLRDWAIQKLWSFEDRSSANFEERAMCRLEAPFINLKREVQSGTLQLSWSMPETTNGEGEVYLVERSWSPNLIRPDLGFSSKSSKLDGALISLIKEEFIRATPPLDWLDCGANGGEHIQEEASEEAPCADEHRMFVQEILSREDEFYRTSETGWPDDDR